MVVASGIATVAAEKAGFTRAERDAEVISLRIDRKPHIVDTPSVAGAVETRLEYVKATIAGMSVAGKIYKGISPHIREGLVSRAIDLRTEIFKRANFVHKIYAPDVKAAIAAGHIGGKI